jgi:hypothetical protein
VTSRLRKGSTSPLGPACSLLGARARARRKRPVLSVCSAWCLALWCWLGFAGQARAIEYEVFVDVDDEEELYDLLNTEQISELTFNTLVDLLRRGTDLNTATREELYALPNLTYEHVDRILAYRDEAGRIADPAALVIAGVVERRLVESLSAFLIIPESRGKKAAVRGFVRYRTVWTVQDDRVPPMALQARVSALRYLTVGGAATLERNRLAPVTWDQNRDGLTTEGFRTQVRPAKIYAMWDTPKWGVIAGTYTIGFGQRLTFDTSGRYTPNGFFLDDTIIRNVNLTRRCRDSAGELTETPCPTTVPRDYVTPDYRIQDRQRGLAAGIKRLDLPVGWMQAYGFFSHQTRSIYQYQVYRPDVCADPTVSSEDDPMCSAPPLYRQLDDPLAPTSTLSFNTLPNMYNEILGGGNTAYWFDSRTHVGLTGYGATSQWLVDGVDLDFQDYSRYPWGGPYGAIGADMSWGHKWSDLFFEAAHSFDSAEPGRGGGPAAIARHTATWDTHEIETSVRYYDQGYANPFARPISAPDQFDGQRARDEAAGRIRYTGTILDRWRTRTFLDVWNQLSDERTKLWFYSRNDVQVLQWWTPGVWFDYQTRDIAARGRGRCYDQGFETEDANIVVVTQEDLERGQLRCQGQRYQITGRSRFDPHKRVNLVLQYRHAFTDDNAYPDGYRQDIAAFGIIGANPIDPLRLRVRVRYDMFDIRDNTRYLQTVWAYFQVTYQIQRWLIPSIRYDIRSWLDDRASTATRQPNPEHWLHFDLTSRF